MHYEMFELRVGKTFRVRGLWGDVTYAEEGTAKRGRGSQRPMVWSRG
jgi:hypothetical protein